MALNKVRAQNTKLPDQNIQNIQNIQNKRQSKRWAHKIIECKSYKSVSKILRQIPRFQDSKIPRF
ncbi:hypothetical protein BKN38_07375 [Helicobacter sp. CLO-3]|nr:hypothetical protein BKN38_07375 [Helicobacter sp. CLO-3]